MILKGERKPLLFRRLHPVTVNLLFPHLPSMSPAILFSDIRTAWWSARREPSLTLCIPSGILNVFVTILPIESRITSLAFGGDDVLLQTAGALGGWEGFRLPVVGGVEAALLRSLPVACLQAGGRSTKRRSWGDARRYIPLRFL